MIPPVSGKERTPRHREVSVNRASKETATKAEMPPACFTFFVPHKDGVGENEELIGRIRRSGKFSRRGALFVTNETDDMFRKGGQFPVFHLEEAPSALRPMMGSRREQSRYLDVDFLGPTADTFQGLYRQVHAFEFDNSSSTELETASVLMAFKSLEPLPDPELVKHWKSWSGARALIVDFASDVMPRSVTFYVLEAPLKLDIFMYVVLIKTFVSDNSWCIIRHLVQRFRVERQFGYISVYKDLTLAPGSAR